MTDDERVIADYRGLLTRTEQESQTEYDKTVLALSGGALGLSFAFTKDIVGTENLVHTGFLLAAWIGWALSSTAVLVSFFTSQLALRKAIRQLDEGKLGMERPGGRYDSITAHLNIYGLLLFLFGLTMMILFLNYNVKDRMKERKIAVTNERKLDPAKSQQITANGRLTPQPPVALIKFQDQLGKLVPVVSDQIARANAGQLVPQPPVNLVEIDNPASSNETPADAVPVTESSSDYETTTEQQTDGS